MTLFFHHCELSLCKNRAYTLVQVNWTNSELIFIYIYSNLNAICMDSANFLTVLEDFGDTGPDLELGLSPWLCSPFHKVVAYNETLNFQLFSDQESFLATTLCLFDSHQRISSLVSVCDTGPVCDTGSSAERYSVVWWAHNVHSFKKVGNASLFQLICTRLYNSSQ